jgi:hypothetical protein
MSEAGPRFSRCGRRFFFATKKVDQDQWWWQISMI